MKSPSFKTTLLFSVMVFTVISLTLFLAILFIIVLFHYGIFQERNPVYLILIIALFSLVPGFILAEAFGKRPVRIIENMTEATKEVPKGNFEVRLDEEIRIEELRQMAHNFNVMAGELQGTELLRNDFVENVSHEFKTPLSAIEGYAMLLQRKELSEEKRIDYASRILTSSKRLSGMTGNILLLSRLEHQETELKKEYFSLDEQIREVILLSEEKWSEKKIDLDIDLDPAEYYGNEELLSQVWQNIFSNALKFVMEGGYIRFILRREEGKVKVIIADNGIGMSKETASRIFEKFYQGDRSRSQAGNGLGLALAKKIVELHGGDITVSSKEGKGTTFTVILPR